MSLSGLQKDVLHLYRALLKTARKKVGGVPKSDLEKLGEQCRPFFRSLRDFITSRFPSHIVIRKFREDAKSLHRNDWLTIEHKIRQGQKQKKLMEMPGFNAASVVKFPH